MRRIVPALAVALIACGPAAEGPGGGSADAGPQQPPGPTIDFSCPNDAPRIENGTNEWSGGIAGNAPRTFHALIPNLEVGTKLGVVFSWHGIGEQLDHVERLDLGGHPQQARQRAAAARRVRLGARLL